MSYTQHEWVTGETITAAKMNNIEDGISEASQGGGGFYVDLTFDLQGGTATTNKNYNEISAAISNGSIIMFRATNPASGVSADQLFGIIGEMATEESTVWQVIVLLFTGDGLMPLSFTANSATAMLVANLNA